MAFNSKPKLSSNKIKFKKQYSDKFRRNKSRKLSFSNLNYKSFILNRRMGSVLTSPQIRAKTLFVCFKKFRYCLKKRVRLYYQYNHLKYSTFLNLGYYALSSRLKTAKAFPKRAKLNFDVVNTVVLKRTFYTYPYTYLWHNGFSVLFQLVSMLYTFKPVVKYDFLWLYGFLSNIKSFYRVFIELNSIATEDLTNFLSLSKYSTDLHVDYVVNPQLLFKTLALSVYVVQSAALPATRLYNESSLFSLYATKFFSLNRRYIFLKFKYYVLCKSLFLLSVKPKSKPTQSKDFMVLKDRFKYALYLPVWKPSSVSKWSYFFTGAYLDYTEYWWYHYSRKRGSFSNFRNQFALVKSMMSYKYKDRVPFKFIRTKSFLFNKKTVHYKLHNNTKMPYHFNAQTFSRVREDSVWSLPYQYSPIRYNAWRFLGNIRKYINSFLLSYIFCFYKACFKSNLLYLSQLFYLFIHKPKYKIRLYVRTRNKTKYFNNYVSYQNFVYFKEVNYRVMCTTILSTVMTNSTLSSNFFRKSHLNLLLNVLYKHY